MSSRIRSVLVLSGLSALVIVSPSPLLDARQTTLPTGWVSVGCYSDVPATRTLRVASFTDVNDMTIESCLAFCTPGGFQFAGVEFARECYCDNVIESPGAPIDDSTCNMACTGDASEICGGAGAINIFHNTAATTTSPPVPTSTATIKQTAGSFQYKGCFDDGVNGAPRSLATQLSVSGGVTAESCTAACKAAGFTLAGLEFGQECWCDKYMSLALPAPDSDCNMVCNADTSELCGAGNRLAVYQDTSATLDVQQCLSAAQLHSSAFHYSLLAVPTSGSGSSFVVGTFELTAQAGQPSFFELSTAAVSNEGHTYTLFVGSGNSGIAEPDSFEGEGTPIPIAPVVGGFQRYALFSTLTPYNGYCAKPNPFSAFGPFIGPPILSVTGHADLWALCNVGAIVFSPQPGSSLYNIADCQNVVLQMIPPTNNF